ncbi:sensor histidine kinase [Bacillus sonorensis]|uniref:sensor histidine kinase n=1 Tax=Bacillus sonorensis TaxID=119858 RepID=UPI001F19B4F3|nr:sensor histidine kinase [Bacillus sonorensis]MCF7616186.1 sensor histidine kinase [Bacillus sonorensis]MCY8402763.1 sensor histidine kinase [Bacillus sonorensis]MCZ0068328.1 sensor histidine kinase [Bacillus sonorensis]MCZ0094723.1 sensor histidine kinase [Bacillus sonorensis]MEC1354361.1 sensor histidine kinase [Bacillus sonorensis]
MEFWMIIVKLTLLGYIVLNCILEPVANLPWIVFYLILYFCINMMISIFQKGSVKKAAAVLSILMSIVSYQHVQPLFILLLPLGVYELLSDSLRNQWVMLAISLIPALFISVSLLPVYGLTVFLNFLIFTILKQHSDRIHALENHIDQTRKDMHKLTKTLHVNKEFIRQSEYTFKLEERNRLSQEIHDKIGHSMTGALIQLEAAKRLLDTDKNKASELLQNAINISKDGIEKIRLTLKNMKPPAEQMGIHRLKLFIDECSALHRIPILFLYKGDLDVITHIQWKIIFENITEALTNTMKYAGATRVSLEIHVLNTLIKTEVKDNGKGQEKIKKGMGIIGMEERAASVNGKVIVDGSNGFSVTTLLPKYE